MAKLRYLSTKDMFYSLYSSPLGQITMLSNDGKSLCGLFFSDKKNLKENSFFKDCEIFAQSSKWLDIYFSGKKPDFTPKLDLKGSSFALSVYSKLLEIKYAQSTTYGAIAKSLDKNLSAQAVGKAVGANPILLIVPCHRVLGADLSLRGYFGGIERKKELLKLEKIAFKST